MIGSAVAQVPGGHHAVPRGSHDSVVHEGYSGREARESAIHRRPFTQLTPEAGQRLHAVIDNASYFRRMPTESIDCDLEMFTFLVRNPEVIVNIWDVMGVTKVGLQRTGPFQLQGNDGAGTSSKMDLVFGNDSMHIYYANGSYHGNMWARELNGKCVVILHNRPAPLANGKNGIVVSMDVFMKLDNMGADLVVKTLGPLVNKTADYNFTECAAFISQLSQTAERNPYGMQELATRLRGVDPKVREQFIATTISVAQRNGKPSDGPIAKQAAGSTMGASENAPAVVLSNKVPPVEQSTRRQPETMMQPIEERVDSPTILLLGKENAAAKP